MSEAADVVPPMDGLLNPDCLFLWGMMSTDYTDQNSSRIPLPTQCFLQHMSNSNQSNLTSANNSFDSLDYNSQIWKLAKKRSKADGFKLILNFLNLYITPVIILIGLIGNIISFLVFSTTHLKRLSSSIYLAALSIADTGFLASLTIVWLSRIHVPIFHSDGWCQLTIYLTHIFSFLSVWFIVSFTGERYIIVYHPLHKDTYCTKRKAKIVIGTLSVVAFILYSSTLFTSGVVKFHTQAFCMPLPQYYEFLTIMTSVDTLMAWVLPSVIIVVLNVKIIMKLHYYQKKYSEVTKSKPTTTGRTTQRDVKHCRKSGRIRTSISTTGSMHIRFSSSHNKEGGDNNNIDFHTMEIAYPESCQKMLRNRTQFRTARMLLILSSVFVLLNLPSHVFRIYTFVESIVGNDTKATREKVRWQELFHLVYFLNFAINFFVYSACGRQFRTGMARLCKKCSHKSERCKVIFRGGSSEKARYIGTRCEIRINKDHDENLKQINFL